VVRKSLLAVLIVPAIAFAAWGDTWALYLGRADEGAQAHFYAAPRSEPGRHNVRVLETTRIVPSAGLPSAALVHTSNNNLDVVRHDDGRVYLAWRTAPDHFAGPDTVIQVVSSADERTWRLEKRIELHTDLREPRLLSWHGSLFLYVSQLGSKPWRFEPQGVLMTEKRADGSWSEIGSIGLPGYIAWRTRIEQGRPYMSAYSGGGSIYNFDGEPLHVDLLTTENGRDWTPADPRQRSVYVGGGSEADFTIDDAGGLYAVIRNEAGDASGFGSKVCSAPKGQWSKWSCHSDPRKFDSPQMFRVNDEVYLVARRDVSHDGRFERFAPSQLLAAIRNQLSYVTTAKRCALWRFDRPSGRVVFVEDLPSRGDTCFPAVLPTDREDQVAIYNYSSAVDGPDVPWSVGQRKPTYIYRHLLSFTPAQQVASAPVASSAL